MGIQDLSGVGIVGGDPAERDVHHGHDGGVQRHAQRGIAAVAARGVEIRAVEVLEGGLCQHQVRPGRDRLRPPQGVVMRAHVGGDDHARE